MVPRNVMLRLPPGAPTVPKPVLETLVFGRPHAGWFNTLFAAANRANRTRSVIRKFFVIEALNVKLFMPWMKRSCPRVPGTLLAWIIAGFALPLGSSQLRGRARRVVSLALARARSELLFPTWLTFW